MRNNLYGLKFKYMENIFQNKLKKYQNNFKDLFINFTISFLRAK